MSKKLYEESDVQAVADAIREKGGGTDKYKLSEMAQAIKNLPSGGGGGDIDALIDGSITSLESDVAKIKSYAFATCSDLASANLPNATSLGNYAFFYCSDLTSANAPNATSLGNYGFAYCSALTSANLPKATKLGNYAFANCSALASVTLPNATSIPNYCFSNCTSLATVDLGCATSIGTSDVFNKCKAIKALIIRTNSVCNGGSNSPMFNNSSLAKGYSPTGYIYVPDDLVDSYKSTYPWSSNPSIIKPLSEYEGA